VCLKGLSYFTSSCLLAGDVVLKVPDFFVFVVLAGLFCHKGDDQVAVLTGEEYV